MKWLFKEKWFPSWKETKNHFKDDWAYYAAFLWLGVWLGILEFPIWTWQYWVVITPTLLLVQIHTASKSKRIATNAIASLFRTTAYASNNAGKPVYDEPTPVFGDKVTCESSLIKTKKRHDKTNW